MDNKDLAIKVSSVCTICESNCGMMVEVQNGELVKTEGIDTHPNSMGFICRRCKALPEILKAPDRLRHPLQKQPDGSWLEISWDQALDYIGRNLTELKQRGCPHHLAVHVGQAGVGKQWIDYIKRFCSIYGTPNLSTAWSYCHTSRHLANILTFGFYPTPDYRNSDCIVLWGYNPTQSSPPVANKINQARNRGARLIVVDPYSSKLASGADLHLQVRPGTDLVLALGLLNQIITKELYDKDIVRNYTVGFDELVEVIKPYTPEVVEAITWVPAAQITEAARLYGTTSPACIEHGMALELQANGFQTIRAIAIMQSITGNLDIAGGALNIPDFELDSLSLDTPADVPPAIGQEMFPLFFKFNRQAQSNVYYPAILDSEPYPIESMIVVGSNPLLAWPNHSQVKTALESLKMLVVVDNVMTATGQLADLVLPAANFLCQNELWQSMTLAGECVLGLAPKVLEEEGCLGDWVVWNRLAQKLGYADYFPWDDDEEALDERLGHLGLRMAELQKYPQGWIYAKHQDKGYEKNGFATNSGKIEISSRVLQEYGYDPLPGYQDFKAGKIHALGTSEEYPLTLSFGTRSIGLRQSQGKGGKKGKNTTAEPYLDIHPAKAEELGISEDEAVVVESPRGRITIRTAFNYEIDPRVVFIAHGWDEANAHILIGEGRLDPITGFPIDRSISVRVRKRGA